MEGLYHRLELGNLAAGVAGTGIPRSRREEIRGVVSPVVTQSFVDEMLVIEDVVNRHELNGRNAQLLQIRDGRLRCHSRVGAAQFFRYIRVAMGKALDVDFIDDGV